MGDYDVESLAGSLSPDEITYEWKNLHVSVKDRTTKKPLSILSSCNGIVKAGEMLAIIGPSGSGKTTLLNALARRPAAAGATTSGQLFVNGHETSLQSLRRLSTYVEQEDGLIGCLTVRETMRFASELSLASAVDKKERLQRVEELIDSFGLQTQANTIVGTPLSKGLSGGQKKRLGVASRLITNPRIVFLDEPTSGLDSTLSFEVMSHVKKIAAQRKPSTSTFRLFDNLCLLAKGKMCYFGPSAESSRYFADLGYQLPLETNPAEFYLELVNTDVGGDETLRRMQHIAACWSKSDMERAVAAEIEKSSHTRAPNLPSQDRRPNTLRQIWVLLQRSWVKAYRDIVAYNIRIIMYLGLAILMGTVFLRFSSQQRYIQPYINAIFFGGAFMSFMAVAYVPAYLEDLHTFRQERANGLVDSLAFSVANFLIGLPFLFAITLLFSVVAYFLINFRGDAGAFFMFVLWLFLDLVAAESLVVLVSSVFPNFVVALALTAFANGLWMCVDGFLVPMGILNVFWKYVFHYIDYQAYVFQGMMVNEFEDRIYDCASDGSGYQCAFSSDLNGMGKIRGESVLESLSIETGAQGRWIGIMIGIIAGYRLLSYLALVLRRQ